MRIHRARNSQKLCTTRLRSFRDASFNHSLWTLILTEPTVMQRFCISQLCAIDCQEPKSEFLSWWNAAIQLAGTERWWWLTLSARVSERLGWRDSKHFVNSHATSHVYLFNVLKWMYRGGWLIGKTTAFNSHVSWARFEITCWKISGCKSTSFEVRVLQWQEQWHFSVGPTIFVNWNSVHFAFQHEWVSPVDANWRRQTV